MATADWFLLEVNKFETVSQTIRDLDTNALSLDMIYNNSVALFWLLIHVAILM